MSLEVQFASLLASIATGIWIGLSLETYDRLAGSRRPYRKIRILNDFLFWVIQLALYFSVLLNVNNGEVRLYLLLALLLGYSIYRALFENVFRRVLEVIIRICSQTGHILVRIVYIFLVNPTKGILNLLIRSGIIIITSIWGLLSFFIKWVFRPVFWLVHMTDQKLGQPFLKQRQQICALIRKMYRFLKKDKGNDH